MSLLSHPVKKLTLLAAFGGGYVLGAKAGRERYEQIRHTAQQVADDPRVQQATAQAQEFVRDTAEKVKDDPRVQDVAERVSSVTKHAAETVEETVDSATDQAADTAKAATEKIHAASASASSPAPSGVTNDVHPLLADEHVATDDEVVYSAGPDIEESIDELADVDPTKNAAAEDRGGRA